MFNFIPCPDQPDEDPAYRKEQEQEKYDELQTEADIKNNLRSSVTEYIDTFGVPQFDRELNEVLTTFGLYTTIMIGRKVK